jgi:hypothetical protein
MTVPELAAWVPSQRDPDGRVYLARVAEGFCPYGDGPLEVVDLHGRRQGCCRACGCSWYVEGGVVWGCACSPDDHTCGEGGLR